MSDEPQKRSVEKVSGWKLLALFPLAMLTRLWTATLRMEATPEFRRFLADDRPQVFLLWHNRLFVIAEINRRFRRKHSGRQMHGLISASKDGAWLAAFFQLVGIRAIRGSSSWRAAEALRETVRVVTDDGDIGITPDGPRGPCYNFQAGALLVAKKANVPAVIFGIEFANAKRLGSWDGFYLPRPFSKVKLSAERYDTYDALLKSCRNGEKPAKALEALLKETNRDTTPHPRENAGTESA
ncbi:DUF374 domain-containing protein [Rubellicoccus peritrichatus]|uniref:DUF374 domain-containing protein n=1 Tax=Rubellicoccus peritrichatus TaxID=3080537 RepID=A0AAQ3QSJ6_9BACT|nr:DUF374 domain-containing protein [Puniceicoccus sp. CR14]WOO42548.1 DUF374 domain-containing protein [Puniceicoccus sp. CR14]